jgi:transcriptional regulator with XRE-family HTH domain
LKITRAGVDRTYISQLEHDKKSPTIQMLFRLCAALDVSPADVIGRLERQSKTRGKPSKASKRKL